MVDSTTTINERQTNWKVKYFSWLHNGMSGQVTLIQFKWLQIYRMVEEQIFRTPRKLFMLSPIRWTRSSVFLFVIVMTSDVIFLCPLSLHLVCPSCTTRAALYISISFHPNCIFNKSKYSQNQRRIRRPRRPSWIHACIVIVRWI